MSSKLYFYTGTDNYQDIVFLHGGGVFDTEEVTHIVVSLGGEEISSIDSPDSFVIPFEMEYRGETVNGIRINLAKTPLSSKLNEKHRTRITLFSDDFPAGIVWDDNILTTVYAPL